MKRASIGGGVYADEIGGFWARPWINKRRTWRKLKATNPRAAIKEANGDDFKSNSNKFADLAAEYIKQDCPNRRLEKRDGLSLTSEVTRVKSLTAFFGSFDISEIRMPHYVSYKLWRVKKVERGTGERTVELEGNTLSNILSYGVATGRIELNFIRSGRPKFQKPEQVKRSRDKAPKNGDELNRLADYFFSDARSEVLGWQLLFAAMTGCRTSELLRLRLDASNPDHAGFMSGNFLFLGRRSKSGVHPYSQIVPEFQEMIECFLRWHKDRYPSSPWFFPGRTILTIDQATEALKIISGGTPTRAAAKKFGVSQTYICDLKTGRSKGGELQPVDSKALAHGLQKAVTACGLHHITPHGLRSFYVTKRRSEMASDAQIAAEIGDKTVSLIQQTYGDLPKSWQGGQIITWKPNAGLPAWSKWSKIGGAEVRKPKSSGLFLDYEQKELQRKSEKEPENKGRARSSVG